MNLYKLSILQKLQLAWHTDDLIALNILSCNSRIDIRIAVAKNSNLTHDIVNRLIMDKSPGVRAAIARRENLTEEQFSILVDDTSKYVLVNLADNWSLPSKFFEAIYFSDKFCNDESSNNKLCYIRDSILWRKNVYSDTIFEHAFNEAKKNNCLFYKKVMHDNRFTLKHFDEVFNSAPKTHAFMASGSRAKPTPDHILYKIFESDNLGIKKYLAFNGLIPLELLQKLSQDKDKYISNVATKKLIERKFKNFI